MRMEERWVRRTAVVVVQHVWGSLWQVLVMGTSSGTDVLAMRNPNDGEKVWRRREKVRVYRETRKHNGKTK